MHIPRPSILALVAVALSGALSAQVECANVLTGFGSPGVDGTVRCLRVFDDGTGPALYVGGTFPSAGTVAAANIAKFDGAHWSALGSGLTTAPGQASSVDDLVVFDFGSGPCLVASGSFWLAGGVQAPYVAAWDGATWTAIGNGLVHAAQALIAFDDGAVSKLYAAVDGGSVVRWSGTAWDPLPSPGSFVFDFAVHDDGGGPALYAGGYFSNGLHSVAKWTGASWMPLTPALGSPVICLASHDDGSGRKLYAGGSSTAFVSAVVRRNGLVWEDVGTMSGRVEALEEIDLLDGNGPLLRAAVTGLAAPDRVVRWDGTTWSDEGLGLLVRPGALTAFDAGNDPRLFAGSGLYSGSEIAGLGLVRLEAPNWVAAHSGRGLAGDIAMSDIAVNVLAQHDAGSGPEVHAGGRALFGAPGVVSSPIARWTGSGWADMGLTQNPNAIILAMESFDLGAGREFFAGGEGGVMRRSGASWVGFPTSLFRTAYAFQVFDVGAGPLLAACGTSFQFPNLQRALVRTWNGIDWTTIGSSSGYSRALALAYFDDGSGPALYCAGGFYELNNVAGTTGIARWNGASWSSVGGGLDLFGFIEALIVHDDGTGPALYAGGRFSGIGGAPIADIARWDGLTWSPVGASGTSGSARGVVTFAVHDSGAGPTLWAGGDFTAIGGVAANRIARWNGAQWLAFGSGADGVVNDLGSFDEGTGSPPVLWAAGGFASIDGVGSSHVARIGCTDQTGYAFCFGDAAHGPTACPCANAGANGHGCASIAVPVGAILEAGGTTAPATPGGVDSVSLVCSGMPNATTALFFQGSQRIVPTPFGDGVLCVGGTTLRLAIKHASAGVAHYPGQGDAPLSVRGQTQFGSGITSYYQVWYRTSSTLCTSATYNISSAREITW